MFQFSQQFSAVAKSQLDAHLRLVDDLTGKAFDNAGTVIALQFGASRALLDSGAALAQQLFSLKGAQQPVAALEPALTPIPSTPSQTESSVAPAPVLVEAAAPDAPAEALETAELAQASIPVSAVTPVAQAVAELTEPSAQMPAAAPVAPPKPIEVTTLKPAQEAPLTKAARARADAPLKTKPATGAPKPGDGQARK